MAKRRERARGRRSQPTRRRRQRRESAFGSRMPWQMGGIRSDLTGMGGEADKGASSYWEATGSIPAQQLDIMYNESFAVSRFIDIPVDDQFLRPRVFSGPRRNVERMEEAELLLEVSKKISMAMKSGQLYGTALMCMVTTEAPLTSPLLPEKVRPGDLRNLVVASRFNVEVAAKQENVREPRFGEPLLYLVRDGAQELFTIHASRVLRFDGRRSLTDFRTNHVYDAGWGVSAITPVARSVVQDAALVAAITHLTQESSIPVMKLDSFEQGLFGEAAPDELTLERQAHFINLYKSIYRMMFLNQGDEFQRVAVYFSGLPELMDRFATRIAAAAGIPATRFWGRAPLGMNATGESDMHNYAITVMALQEKLLRPQLDRLDAIVARHAGLRRPLEYKFPSLLEVRRLDQAEINMKLIDAVGKGVQLRILDENEARRALARETDFFGPLPDIDLDLLPEPSSPADAIGFQRGEQPDEDEDEE